MSRQHSLLRKDVLQTFGGFLWNVIPWNVFCLWSFFNVTETEISSKKRQSSTILVIRLFCVKTFSSGVFVRFIHDFRRLFPKIGHIVSCASLIFKRGYCFVWFCFLFLFCFLLLFQITPCTILPISWHFMTRSAYTLLTLCYLCFSDAKNFYVFVIGLIRQGDPIFQFKISV